MSHFTHEAIKETLKKTILIQGLELGDLGIRFEEITDDVVILGEEGLALDSVDALEILSLVNRHFGIQVSEANKEFFAAHLASFDRLYAFVVANYKKQAA